MTAMQLKKSRNGLSRLRWAVLEAFAPRRKVVARGLTFTLQSGNPVTHYRWRNYNAKEPETLDWIDRWMQEGDLFFDIGANVGSYSIYAALRHVQSRVVAFEPEYANLFLLRQNLLHNGLQERVEVYSVALGNRVGLSRLHIQDWTPGAALHTESPSKLTQTIQKTPVIGREGIAVTTLDLFCRETGLSPNCLKIDVDGTEPAILEGAGETLRSSALRSLILEMSQPEIRSRCVPLLERAGLRRIWADPAGRKSNEIWSR